LSEAVDFQEVQEFFGFQESAPVEKDWHVIRAMRAIATVDASPFRLVFAGGTCLARAYRLTSRMSEDVDFKVEHIGEKPLSANQLRKQLGELRPRIATALQDADFSLDASQIKLRISLKTNGDYGSR